MNQVFSMALKLTGGSAIILSTVLLIQHYNPYRTSFKNYVLQSGNVCKINDRLPRHISIPSINLSLPVETHDFKKGLWKTSTKGISYQLGSPISGETGNSIFYGHNWSNLLGNLHKVRPGDSVIIDHQGGLNRKFIVESVSEVSPDATSILSQTNDKRITIYTCSGFLDTKRLVVVAKLSDEVILSSN